MTAIQDPAPRSLQLLATITIFAAATLALVNLPAEELPVEWLLAFSLPGAILGSWSRTQRTPWQRALFAVLLQAGACWAALELVGPMTRPAALACTILPPLAFATSRNHDADPSLSLFLSFCVLLVGIILDGLHLPILIGYGLVAILSLHASTLLASHRSASMRHRPVSRLRPVDAAATSMLACSCLLAMFAIDRTLRCLPSPSRAVQQDAAQAGHRNGKGPRSVGLDDSFVLDGDAGSTLNSLKGEQLVRIAHTGDRPVSDRLYLRCGFFSEPKMDRWEIGTLQLSEPTRTDRLRIRLPWSGIPVQQLDIERYSGARKFLFLPPGSINVEGISDLRIDRMREWVRPAQPNDDLYSILYQQVAPPEPYARFDPRAAQLGMLQLPQNLDRDALLALMNDWGVSNEPLQAMEAIARGLAKRCRYQRREPIGPFAHAIENFLFAEGDRYGYCMHFATAATLMLRLQGIPSRLGVGLYGGEAEDDGLTRVYGSQHAHAWVEIPFEGSGYYIYDPTPPDSRGRGFVPDNNPLADAGGGDAANSSSLQPAVRAATKALSEPWLWAIVLLVALVIAMIPRRQPKPPKVAEPVFARHARRSLIKLLRTLAAAGLTRSRGQTLELFAKEIERRGQLPAEVKLAFTTYQEVRFGGRPYNDERHERMQRAVRSAIELRDDQRATAEHDAAPATGQ